MTNHLGYFSPNSVILRIVIRRKLRRLFIVANLFTSPKLSSIPANRTFNHLRFNWCQLWFHSMRRRMTRVFSPVRKYYYALHHTNTQRLTEHSLCKMTRKTTLILGVKPSFLNYFSWNAKNYFKLHDFSHTRLIHWDLEMFELKLEQSMDVIGQHLDLPDADWLTFGTLNREDWAASTLRSA